MEMKILKSIILPTALICASPLTLAYDFNGFGTVGDIGFHAGITIPGYDDNIFSQPLGEIEIDLSDEPSHQTWNSSFSENCRGRLYITDFDAPLSQYYADLLIAAKISGMMLNVTYTLIDSGFPGTSLETACQLSGVFIID